jgi:hypothetical protein
MKDKEFYTPEEVGSMVSMAYNLGIAREHANDSSEARSSYMEIMDKSREQIPRNIRECVLLSLVLKLD